MMNMNKQRPRPRPSQADKQMVNNSKDLFSPPVFTDPVVNIN